MLFVLVAEDDGAAAIPLPPTGVTLGRNEATGNTDPNVSQEHAAVEVAADHIVVTALGMNAPMIFHKDTTAKPMKMKKGQKEVLQIGDAVALLQSGKYKYTLAEAETLDKPPDIDVPLRRRSSLIEPQPYEEVAVEAAAHREPPAEGPSVPPEGTADAPPAKKAKIRHAAPDIRPSCKYGADCYRHDRRHFEEYRHPHLPTMASEEDMAAECSDEDATTGGVSEPHSPAASPAPPPARPAAILPLCPHGAKCYRTNADHRAEYSHFSPAAAKGAVGPPAAPSKGVGAEPTPKHFLADGDVHIMTHGLGQYKIKNAGGVYYCSCVAWRFQRTAVDERTCKHLVEFLGEDYMAWRLRNATGAEAADMVMDIDGGSLRRPAARPMKCAAPAVLLANKWEEGVDPTGWWLSEKLDGVRAYWTGTRFLSRLGNEFVAPAYFTKELPRDVILDGELFGGRKKFQFTVGVVKSSAKTALWRSLTYQVFDAPGLKKPFEERMAYLEAQFGEAKKLDFTRVVEHIPCRGIAHLYEKLKEVEKMGGEGLMLREPRSAYVGARSNTLLKVKSVHDYEAKVIAHETGKGKNAHRTGALLCVLPNGKKFSVGSGLTDRDRDRPPKVGSIITFRFQELSDAGHPRFPRYMGVRADAKWPPDSPWPP